ncbi:MAG: hypothetical protein EBT27_11110, partial [Betaproteobacteria bacterium]|nr:hypothetical protein [Betaproteobacteria bacterium]
VYRVYKVYRVYRAYKAFKVYKVNKVFKVQALSGVVFGSQRMTMLLVIWFHTWVVHMLACHNIHHSYWPMYQY